MEGTISLYNLLQFINSMSLTSNNKRWLAEKLIESSENTPPLTPYTKEELDRRIDEGMRQVENGETVDNDEVMAYIDSLLED